MSWQDEMRANRAAKAEAARLQQQTETGNDIALMHAAGQEARADRELAADLAAKAKDAADAERVRRKGVRAKRRAAVKDFAKSHVVDGLIYAIAVVSFVMAASAMAGYGATVYDSPLGKLLPLITELGMWAFAVAVLAARSKDKTRPVWGYQAGVWVFGTLAFVTNAVHGLARGFDAGLIMGVVSVAGVIAHQLAIATPPRPAAQRAADKLAAAAAAKTNAAARAALKSATAQVDAAGNARLTYAPGTYEIRRSRLVAVEADPDVPGPPDAMDVALAALLNPDRPAPRGDGGSVLGSDGGVATAEAPRDDTTDGPGPDRPAPRRTAPDRPGKSGGGRAVRDAAHFAQLRTRLAEAVAAGDIDPAKASIYAIAKTLHCGKPAAKRLHAELRNPQD